MAKIYKHKKNDFAILGLVFSILFGLPGLIFSIIGLNQIKKTGQEGKGMCIAGIIISSIRMILAAILCVILVIAVIAEESYGYYDMDDYERCTSIYTDCDDYSWECEEDGCWCTYDDGWDYEYFWCDSWDFEY